MHFSTIPEKYHCTIMQNAELVHMIKVLPFTKNVDGLENSQ